MFEVGVASAVITPPAGIPMAGYIDRDGVAKGVHDNLFAKALVLDDGQERIALVRCDLIGLGRKSVERIRSRVRQIAGIREGNLMVASTHTHSGPQTQFGCQGLVADYVEELESKVANVVSSASERMAGATLASVIGKAYISRNRLPPDSSKLHVDPDVGIVRFTSDSRKIIATLVNYSCHPVVLGPDNLLISADYPGHLMNLVEKHTGAPCLFITGACGDINPDDSLTAERLENNQQIGNRTGGTFEEAERIGTIIGAETLKWVLSNLPSKAPNRLSAASYELEIPMKNLPSLEEAMEKEKTLMKEIGEAGSQKESTRKSRELLSLSRSIEAIKQGNMMRTELQAISVGDIVIVGLPGEPFVDVGLTIKDQSPFRRTLVSYTTNDYIGYFPTVQRAIAGYKHGYDSDHLPIDLGDMIVKGALQAIRDAWTKS